jgi:hypothetical protein
MTYKTHNSIPQVRRLEQLDPSCVGRRAWLTNFH